MQCNQCERPAIARQMCTKHYQRWARSNRDQLIDTGKGTPAIERIMARIELRGDCWIYTGATDKKGYARVRENGKKQFAHRVTWQHFIGQFPAELTFDHLCKTPSCVNPWHGEAVTREVNSARNQNADKTHCPNGHPLSGENLRFASHGKGRVCRTCRAESSRRYRLRLKAAA